MAPPNPLALQAAQPAPMVPNYGMGVPIVPMVGNTRSTTTASPEISRRDADEFKRRNQQILDDQEEQRRKANDAALIRQLQGEKHAADLRAEHAKFAEARILGEEEGKRDFEAAKNEYAAEKAKREAMKPTEFWGSKTTEQKIWAGVAASLGAIGAGLRAFSGERGVDPTSGVMGIFEKQIAAHNERETAKLKHQDDIVTRAHGGIGAAEDRAERRNRTALANESAAWNRILRTFEVEANAAGMPKEALEANRDYIAAKDKALAADLRFTEMANARSTSTRTQTEAQQMVPGSVLGGPKEAKPPSEKEQAAALDAEWKEAALKRAQELDPSGRGFARAQKAMSDAMETAARDKTALGKVVNAAGQAVGQLPASASRHKLLQGDSPEAQSAREWWRVLNAIGTEQAHIDDPVGAIGKDSSQVGMESQAVTSKGRAEVIGEVQRMIERQKRIARGAAAPRPITPPPVGGPPMPETKQAAASTDRAAAYRHLIGQKDPLTGKKITDVEMGPNGRPVITTED